MAYVLYDPWGPESHLFAGEVQEQCLPTHSRLLGPDGNPLPYARQRIGFDLTPRAKREEKQ